MSDKLKATADGLKRAIDACTNATAENFLTAVEATVSAWADFVDAIRERLTNSRAAVGVASKKNAAHAAERGQTMKTTDELKAMLPPEVSGIAGCTAYNERRAQAFAAVEVSHRMTTAKLSRVCGDDVTRFVARINLESDFHKEVTTFERAVAKLAEERRVLLCEPDRPWLPIDSKSIMYTTMLLPANVPNASAFNAKVRDYGKRLFAATDALGATRANAIFAWADSQTDANTRAMNIAQKALRDAQKPFQAERVRLEAARVSLTTKKAKVTK